jgi:aryl-alcohol dehydrogenase-like predicted oxidoreductase
MKLMLGTAQLGMDYGIQGGRKPKRKEALSLLFAAYERGVRTLDTAAAYGDAEEIIGQFLQSSSIDRIQMALCTKLPKNVLQGLAPQDYAPAIARAAEKSMERMQTDCLDILLFHDASMVLNNDAMRALIEVKNMLPVKKTGLSVYTPEEAMAALKYPLDIVQAPYNALDTRLKYCGFFEKAAKRGVMFIARSVLLQGLLTISPENLPGGMAFARPYLLRFREICNDFGISPLACAFGFAAACQPDYLLFGVDNTRQMEECITAAHPLDANICAVLDKSFADLPPGLLMPHLWQTEVRT